MVSVLPFAASILGSICYGAATVLEQVGAKKEKKLKNINPLSILKLFRQGKYFLGIVLDVVGWLFFLVAVRSLPLFLVQSFIALSIVVSALLDRYWLKHPIFKTDKISILFVILGVTLLSIVAKPGPADVTSTIFKQLIVIGPVLLAVIAAIVVKLKSTKWSTSITAILVGLAFGGTSVATRILVFKQIDKQAIQIGILLSLVVYGILAITLLSIALQRERVNRVNSLVLASEVLFPSLIGLFFLGDGIKDGLWVVLVIGLVLVVSGTLFTLTAKRSTD